MHLRRLGFRSSDYPTSEHYPFTLSILNETQRVEMARKLAERLLREGADDAARFDRLFGLLACRAPTGAERGACDGLLGEMRGRYAADPSAAEALLSIGDAGRDASVDVAELAAWTQVAATVLASDIALTLY